MNVFHKPRRNIEHRFQNHVARFLNVALPTDSFWSSIDHAGPGLRQGANKKARGVVAGLPDVLILWRQRTYWLELKAPKGSIAPEQRDCHALLHRAGSPVGIARDLNDVQFWLEQWSIPLRAVVDPRSLSGARSIA